MDRGSKSRKRAALEGTPGKATFESTPFSSTGSRSGCLFAVGDSQQTAMIRHDSFRVRQSGRSIVAVSCCPIVGARQFEARAGVPDTCP